MTTVPRIQHVANGTATTDIIAAAGLPGQRSIWADPLHDGPVPAGLGDAELLDVRAQFHADPIAHPYDVVARDFVQWRRAIDEHDKYDELVLWYEHDLFDQLNLLQILSRIPRRLPRGKPVSLINIGEFAGRPRFKGLGELTPSDLASLFPVRQRVSDAQYALAERAWQAFRAPTPDALQQQLAADTSPLPFLARALRRFLEEYPSTAGGLSRTERRFLELAETGPRALMDIFPRMHDHEDAYYVTDSTLSEITDRLSHGVTPLIEVAGDTGESGPIRLRRSVNLTPTGRDVLAGRKDAIDVMGIDRWFGGVHLHADGDIWRWDPNQGCVVRTAPTR